MGLEHLKEKNKPQASRYKDLGRTHARTHARTHTHTQTHTDTPSRPLQYGLAAYLHIASFPAPKPPTPFVVATVPAPVTERAMLLNSRF